MPILFSFLSNHRDFPSDSDSDDPDFEGGDSMDTEDSGTSEKVSLTVNFICMRVCGVIFLCAEPASFDWKSPGNRICAVYSVFDHSND